MILALLSCATGPLAWPTGNTAQLSVTAETLDFGQVALGGIGTLQLGVVNEGVALVTVEVTVAPPFTTDRTSLDLGAEGQATLAISFAPVTYDPASELLDIRSGETVVEVALTGIANPDSDGDGYLAVVAGGDDCDDADAAIHPGAVDTCYDGVDTDCAADDDDDCDHDGVPVATDCDDADATAAPGLPEIGPDDHDEDCDGLIDEHLLVPGDLFLSELRPDADGWFEVCNASTRAIRLDGLTLTTTAGSVVLDPSAAQPAPGSVEPATCVGIRTTDTGEFTWAAALALAPVDTVTLAAEGLPIDTIVVASGWGWSTGTIYWVRATGASADGNDAVSAWCAGATGTWGEPNPAGCG